MNESKTYCPLAWNHFSAYAEGDMRLCCNVKSNSYMNDNDGNRIQVGTVTNLLEYFNLDKYKEIRKNMMSGVKTPDCSICYGIEENKGKSMRQYWVEAYPFEKFKDITNEETGEISEARVNYLDISWSNKCNLKCRMCSPYASDQLIKEAKELKLMPHIKDIDIAFDWNEKWSYETIIPILEQVVKPELDSILVTGGEPLINNEFYVFCQMLVDKDYAKNIDISFHTNLTVMPQKWLDILSNFKSVVFKVSIDGVGECYEYIRYPGKWAIIKKNIEDLCFVIRDKTNFSVEFHTVLSIFNYKGITDLLDYLMSLPEHEKIKRLPHFNFIHVPFYASPTQLPFKEKLDAFVAIEEWLLKNSKKHKLLEEKVSTLRAVAKIMTDSLPDRQEETIDMIKKVDSYRGHDTKKYMPWITK